MARVDPFNVPIPRKWSSDPELSGTVTFLWKFFHDIWQRTGAGTDSVAGAAQTTGATFTGNVNLSSAVLQVDGTQVVGGQQAAVADIGAASATNPSPPSTYTPHASGAVPVTSSAATDLDAVAAALDTLVDEVTAYEIVISNLVTDVADIRTQMNDLLAKLRTHGTIAT